jgi:nitrogen fixation protein NifX
MNETMLQHEIALRIGLAARELPGTDAARVLRVLQDAVGLPPTAASLSTLTVKALRSAAGGELADLDTDALKRALDLLKGAGAATADPLPGIQPYAKGDMPNSIRVACASNKGERLDGHFGSCQRFLVYQVSADENRLIAIRSVDAEAQADDKNGYRASLVSDCQILFVASIGGPAAAKVVRAGVHPIKKPEAELARDAIGELQAVIGVDAPPWLAKVMGQSPEQRIRFEKDAVA